MRFPRRRLCDVGIYGLVSVLISVLPFNTVLKHPETFQPDAIRKLFLICVTISWPLNLMAAILSLLLYLNDTSKHPEKRYLTPPDHLLTPAIYGILCAVLGSSLLVVSQCVWVFVASRVGIVWVLCLVVLGLAWLVITTASLIASLFLAIRTRCSRGDDCESPANRIQQRDATVLQIDQDSSSPQKVVATIPNKDSELVF